MGDELQKSTLPEAGTENGFSDSRLRKHWAITAAVLGGVLLLGTVIGTWLDLSDRWSTPSAPRIAAFADVFPEIMPPLLESDGKALASVDADYEKLAGKHKWVLVASIENIGDLTAENVRLIVNRRGRAVVERFDGTKKVFEVTNLIDLGVLRANEPLNLAFWTDSNQEKPDLSEFKLTRKNGKDTIPLKYRGASGSYSYLWRLYYAMAALCILTTAIGGGAIHVLQGWIRQRDKRIDSLSESLEKMQEFIE